MKQVVCENCGHVNEVKRTPARSARDNPALLLRKVRAEKKRHPKATGTEIGRRVGCDQPYVSRLLSFDKKICPDVLARWEASCDAGSGLPIEAMMNLAARHPKGEHDAHYRRLLERRRIDREREFNLRRRPRSRAR